MQAGKLDRRVTLLRNSGAATDSFNSPKDNWTVLATVWASKADVSDRERFAASEIGATIDTRFQIRWSSAVSTVGPKDQLVCEGHTYDITGAKEIPRRQGIELTATRRNEDRP